jgi:DNA-binding transcriptional ArsR family regulator
MLASTARSFIALEQSRRAVGDGLSGSERANLVAKKLCLHGVIISLTLNQMVKYSSETLNRTFAALADPTRRRILAHLARGDKRVTHLARPHAMSLPAVSKHLRVLEKAGLLRRRRYGRVHEMQLDAKPLKQAAQWVEEYRKFWEGSLDRLAEYLERTAPPTKQKRNNVRSTCVLCVLPTLLLSPSRARAPVVD